MDKVTIKRFTDLTVWKKGHKLVLIIYTITTKFPKSESYALIDQMRRCVVSITSNIAEGFSRKSKKEKIQFYYMALGSLTELQNQLIIAKDLGYLRETEAREIFYQTVEIHKMLNALIKTSQYHA